MTNNSLTKKICRSTQITGKIAEIVKIVINSLFLISYDSKNLVEFTAIKAVAVTINTHALMQLVINQWFRDSTTTVQQDDCVQTGFGNIF